MKKLLEVNLCDNFEIRFKTDIDVLKEQELASMIPLAAAYTMLTKLWGGNETSVLAIIRMLSMADIAVSVDRDEMIEKLKLSSGRVAEQLKDLISCMEKSGTQFRSYGPGIKPPGETS